MSPNRTRNFAGMWQSYGVSTGSIRERGHPSNDYPLPLCQLAAAACEKRFTHEV